VDKQLVAGFEQIFTIRGFLSADECAEQIARAERIGFGDAPINSLGGPVIDKSMRNNERVMFDDLVLAQRLWEKLQPFVDAKRSSGWHALGLNERFRFYRYDPGQRFDWHYDGCFERSRGERSHLTFMIYLNGGFEGGATEFHLGTTEGFSKDDPTASVIPETGMALLFDHRILHQGSPVVSGRKYVLRSDVMYQWKM
jgi:hypothetical protein